MSYRPTSELDLAATRLHRFMDKHAASLDEMQTLLGIAKPKLKLILERRTIVSIYAGEIVRQLGSDMIERSVARLKEMRGGVAVSVKEQTETAPAAPTEEKNMHTNPTAEDLKQAIESAKERLGTSEAALCQLLGKGSTYLANAKANALSGRQNPKKTAEIIAALDALEPAVTGNVQENNADAQKDIPVELDEDDSWADAFFPSTKDPEEFMRRRKQEPVEIPRSAIIAVAKIMLEEEFGIDIEELRSISDQVDLLLLAKSMGVTPRIVVDTQQRTA